MDKTKSKIYRHLFALTLTGTLTFTPAIFTGISLTSVQAIPDLKQTLPLGQSNLKETKEIKEIAKGLTLTQIVRGNQSAKDVYIVDIAFCNSRKEAETIAKHLKSDGYHSKIEKITKKSLENAERTSLGYLVRIGFFKSKNEANKLRKELSNKGYKNLEVVYSGEDGGPTTGPWVVNILEVNLKKFKGKIIPKLGTDIIPDREKVSRIAAKKKALSAINGGFFVMDSSYGTKGDLSGISIIEGNLMSEAINRRTAVILTKSGRNIRIAPVETYLSVVSSNGTKQDIDGLNRKPCFSQGSSNWDKLKSSPKDTSTCADTSGLIYFNPGFGQRTARGKGIEVALDSTGKVIELRKHRGGTIPKGGIVLTGTRDGADWLLAHAKVGTKLYINKNILVDGVKFPVDKTTGMVNGGPSLLSKGKMNTKSFAEGVPCFSNSEFFYKFGHRRNPRTLVGVKKDGTILFVTIDGRHPDYSIGANLDESARIMKSLGAVDAVNLDGGGSTTMTIGSKLITHPSDSTGERPVGDAILIMP